MLSNRFFIYPSSSSPKPTLCPPAFKFRASNNADNVNLTPNQRNSIYKNSNRSLSFLPGFNNC